MLTIKDDRIQNSCDCSCNCPFCITEGGRKPLEPRVYPWVSIRSKMDKIKHTENIDMTFNKVFATKDMRKRMAILSGGRDTKLYKNLHNAMKALENLKSTSSLKRNSQTFNKFMNERQAQTFKIYSDGLMGASRSDASGFMGWALRAASKFMPLRNQRMLQMERHDQEAFFNFYTNPKNTRHVIHLWM